MALKGRVLLLWASPLFNRANDESRWAAAYEYIKESIKDINACGNHLYTTGNNINGSDFAKMFTVIQNPEMVFGTLHNMKKTMIQRRIITGNVSSDRRIPQDRV